MLRPAQGFFSRGGNAKKRPSARRAARPHRVGMGGAKRAEFFHVDLGIGGAENWLVNVALVLQKHDYDV